MLTGAAPASFGGCGPSRFADHGARKPRTVTITGPQRHTGDPPVFYLRFERQEWFVASMRPEDLLHTLEGFGAKPGGATMQNGNSPQPLYDAVKADLPITEDTDLFKYEMKDRGAGSWLQAVVADLATKGLIGIDISPYHDRKVDHDDLNPDPKALLIREVYGGDTLESRYFCTPDGKELFQQGYVVY